MSNITQTPVTVKQQPVNLIELAQRAPQPAADGKDSRTSFKEMFSRELAENRDVKFSRHAHQRLYSRGIELSDESLSQIAQAIDQAQSKGSRETLILTDAAAFVVSVDSRTVITAFDRDHLQQGVVTSIDSAVIL